ncbi:myotubularin-related protein 9 isoform X1 [Hydra vulgaris]|uniref:myotubularin-related protein 9 isoform X1 n=1 Tax=Hydra vulgaris TaxID=6087 RepID=UPI000640D3E5|nr:myotubularin-related protein 9 isoform X1 [Hydra vulgaris]
MEFTELIKTSKVDNVVLLRHGVQQITGTLCLTSHHIIFGDRFSEEIMILYLFIEHLEKIITPSNSLLTIICKDLTSFKLRIPKEEDAVNVVLSIEALSALESAASYYPYYVNRINFNIESDGWALFDMKTEYLNIIGEFKTWKISNINAKHEICLSYPGLVIVPSNATNEMIKKSAKFRHGGRFPVLCYLHSNGVPLMRSSQPLNGPSNKRCKEDEKLLSFPISAHIKKGHIIDTRSQQAASSHRSKGGGFEESDHYSQWKQTYHNIEPYTYLSESLSKLYDACIDKKNSAWLSKLEASGWLSYVQSVLIAASNTARHLHYEASPTLVHGEKGTDCTLLVTSLAQILLDYRCRTVIGLQSLITREWIWAGYPFTERHLKIGVSSFKRKEQAPVFLMFLDCLHQIMNQYASSFEYTEDMLLLLAEHVYASQYGTFLFNNQLQREQSKVTERTVSLWSYMNRQEMNGILYNPIYEENKSILSPSVSPQSLWVWEKMFRKTSYECKSVKEALVSVKKDNSLLKKSAKQLQLDYEHLRAQFAAG